jgi:GTPase SAR1 family protein
VNQNNTGSVYIKYNPYIVETTLLFDAKCTNNADNIYIGEEPKEGSALRRSYHKGKRLQEWIDHLPKFLDESGREKSYPIIFHGTTLDYEDVKAIADANPTIIPQIAHIQGANPEDKLIELKAIFEESQRLGLENINEYKNTIETAFDKGFETYVIATVSAGKSTLINALLKQKLMPSKNEPCTAVVTRIYDTYGTAGFTAYAYGHDDNEPRVTIKELTLEAMQRLNSDPNITNIVIKGDISFLAAKGIPIVIVDTPGPNNSRNTDHKARTMKALESGSQSLIIFVLDATQNGTDSEALLLNDIAIAMKSSGKMSRDRFLFVVNKVDEFSEEPERINGMLIENRDALLKYGITDARIYPISAGVALTSITGIDKATGKARGAVEDMVNIRHLHLERPVDGINSHIPASASKEINIKLAEAIKTESNAEQALIHSGIPSLEAAIKEYIEKYARAMRIEEVSNRLRESLNTADKITRLNKSIMTDNEKRDNILAAVSELEIKIQNGRQGQKYYEDMLNIKMRTILDEVKYKIDELCDNFADEMVEYGTQYIKDRLSPNEAIIIEKELKDKYFHIENKLKSDLSALLDVGIRQSAEKFLEEYRNSIESLITKNEVGALSFDPFSLLEADLSIDTTIDEFIEKEEIFRKVKTGTHPKKNPEREGFWGFFKFWKSWRVDEDEFSIENYTERYFKWIDYSQKFIGNVRANITYACELAKEHAESNSEKMKIEFCAKFELLNKKLLKKTNALRNMSAKDVMLKDRISKNENLQKDIELLQIKLDNILEI